MLHNLGISPNWAGLSIIISILSFVLSIVLLVLTANLKKRILYYSEIKRFNRHRQRFARELTAYRDLIVKDKLLDEKLISDIAKVIHDFNNYKTLRSGRDIFNVYVTLGILKKSKNKLINRIYALE